LLNKYNSDLQLYSAYTTQEDQRKSQFWAEFFGALAAGLSNSSSGIPVYDADECVGPIIMGECKGTIVPKSAYRKRCYGEMLNGRCTGPMF